MKLSDRVVFVMSVKYAQRREAEDVAGQLRVGLREVELIILRLRSQALVRCWPDGQWGLTSSGNALRNHLTGRRSA